jgi:RNA polymerase sigma-70 factor (sigma-E family)
MRCRRCRRRRGRGGNPSAPSDVVGGVEAVPQFEEFVAARSRFLLRYALLLTGNAHDAEDLLQAALAATYRHWRTAAAGDADAYVRRALLNGYLTARKRRLRSPQRHSVDSPASDPALTVPERDAMWRALSALPPRQRAVVVLRYYEDLDEAGIARVLGVSVGTVKSQASKALATLRRMHSTEEVRP